ncbi:MAG: hypothetical protein WCM76_14135 [Bacteroidota bacterium]
MKTKIIFSLLFLATLIGCKYEDGPLISFRTVERRLQGEFQAEEFKIDGQDALQKWKDSICNDYLMMHWSDAGIHSMISIVSTYGSNGGKYIISDDRSSIQFEMMGKTNSYPGIGPFGDIAVSNWRILKLSNKKLWLETDFEGRNYLLKLKKIKDYSK